jgi:hypothetical protein
MKESSMFPHNAAPAASWSARPFAALAAAALLGCVAVALPARVARAGVAITQASGSISFDLVVPTEPPSPNHRDFTATVPGAETVEFTELFSNDTGRVVYDIRQPTANRLTADLQASVATTGGYPDGTTTFAMQFTSDRPLHFRFTTTAEPSQGFSAKLDDVVADAHVDFVFGTFSGSIPHEEFGPYGEFVREGTLLAGTHSFSVDAFATRTRYGGGGSSGAAHLEVTAVPLPAAVWPAGALLAVLAGQQLLRFRRRTT